MNRIRSRLVLFLRSAAVFAVGGCCQPAAGGEVIRGAGASFPAPVYAAWSKDYERVSGVKVSYDAVGSGAGIERIRKREVEFGASDAPLAASELAASGLLQFPAVIGGVVPVINIGGIKPGQLRLNGALLAAIYLGRIRKWSDASIAALNPTLVLPNTNITVVYRNDSSGSSLLWTDYLSHSSSAWKESIGASLAPKWPIGVGGNGNEGVASYVQRTRFAIGYVEYAFARKHRLSDVALLNRSGRFVHAGRDAFLAAALAADWSDLAGVGQLPTDLPGVESWPIAGTSFILIAQPTEHREKTLAVLHFFDWALRQGEPITRSLDYSPVPPVAVDQLPALWRTLRDDAGMPMWP
ncbi:MAG: phosphate ABC transporter substrate-binding protein PstS [Gammaproteobacteria bacterium]